MMRLISFAILCFTSLHAVAESPTVVVVAGAPGSERFGKLINQWSEQWKSAAKQAEATFLQIGASDDKNAKETLRKVLAAEPKDSPHPLWLVLIGHGTFDRKRAKFNLAGPDLEASEFAHWLKEFKRPLVLINCASSSAPFLTALSGKERIVVTATRSGYEQNFCHLGGYLATTISDPSADLDKDNQVSLLEAWLIANRRTADFYKKEGRLATEHSLLDDNADGKGTQSDWFRGLQVTKKSAEEGLLPDGLRAHQVHLIPSEAERKLSPEQRAKRDTLELELARLRAKKANLKEDAYYERLEKLLLEMSRIYFPK